MHVTWLRKLRTVSNSKTARDAGDRRFAPRGFSQLFLEFLLRCARLQYYFSSLLSTTFPFCSTISRFLHLATYCVITVIYLTSTTQPRTFRLQTIFSYSLLNPISLLALSSLHKPPGKPDLPGSARHGFIPKDLQVLCSLFSTAMRFHSSIAH